MKGKPIRYVSGDSLLRVQGVGDAYLMDSDHAFASLEVLGPANLSSLRTAMTNVYKDYDYGREDDPLRDLPRFSVDWSMDPEAKFDDDLSLAEPVGLVLMRDGSLLVQLDVAAGPLPRTENDAWPDGLSVLEGWVKSHGGEVVSFVAGSPAFRWYWMIRMSLPIRGRTLADMHVLGSDAIAVLEAYGSGELTIESLASLLRSGHVGALVGTPENQLLEAKRSLRLEDYTDKLELAKDVSAIANSSTGGVLVVGLATRRKLGRDVISSLHPMPDVGQVRKVRGVLNRLVYPAVERMDVRFISPGPQHRSGEYLLMNHRPASATRTFSIPGDWRDI